MHGRYPDYDVLAEARALGRGDARAWSLARAHDVPPVRFFTPRGGRCLRAFLDVVLAQDAEPRIPVLEMVDAQARTTGELDGYRYADMPEDPETWRLVARGLDAGPRRGVVELRRARRRAARRDRRPRSRDGELEGGRA